MAFAYIKSQPSITHVVMSANFNNYLNPAHLVFSTNHGIVNTSNKIALEYFNNTIKELKKLNITPVVFSPMPKTGFNVGDCLERQYGPAILLRENCYIDNNEVEEFQHLENIFLKEVEKNTNVVWLKEQLCNNDYCIVERNNTFIYRDSGHLTIEGSKLMLNDFQVNDFK